MNDVWAALENSNVLCAGCAREIGLMECAYGKMTMKYIAVPVGTYQRLVSSNGWVEPITMYVWAFPRHMGNLGTRQGGIPIGYECIAREELGYLKGMAYGQAGRENSFWSSAFGILHCTTYHITSHVRDSSLGDIGNFEFGFINYTP